LLAPCEEGSKRAQSTPEDAKKMKEFGDALDGNQSRFKCITEFTETD